MQDEQAHWGSFPYSATPSCQWFPCHMKLGTRNITNHKTLFKFGTSSCTRTGMCTLPVWDRLVCTFWPAPSKAGESELQKQRVFGAVWQTELAKPVGLFRKTGQADLLGGALLSYREVNLGRKRGIYALYMGDH